MKRTEGRVKAMERAIKVVIASSLVCAAAIMGISCDTGSNSDDNPAPNTNPPAVQLGAEFETFYLNIAQAELAGLEGFHFKNLSAAPQGFIIDRIFASQTKSTAGAVDVYTFADPETGSKYWGFGAGTIAGGVWSSGEIASPVAPAVETYCTGFATPEFASAVYVGIVAKKLSATVTGDDITFVPIIGEAKPELGKTFKELFTK